MKTSSYENIIIVENLSETHLRPTRLIRDPSETNIPARRPRHASLDTDLHDRRPTCPIGDRHACGIQTEFKRIYLNLLILYNFCLR